ncbi:flavin reductase family protein [Caballeronia sp. AZ7_KS35]|uniref:flavin reductase family protein n=1 Tax=Caballeronia sp. AZ7_KS35 TaxID=2921762 RepID=UPI0020286109|nr:flavin reductase family protein [Caballeronia sp. AZ7_KS35]
MTISNSLLGDAARQLPSAVDPLHFKKAMRHLAAGVCAVTTYDEGLPHGLLVTAVTSVSAEPTPSLLVCVNQSSSTHSRILNAKRFCVNLLDERDIELARQFMSSDRRARFEGVEWEAGVTGSPILSRALVSFDCDIEQAVQAGSHTICIGRVREVRVGSDAGQPLLYCGASFAGVRPTSGV